MDECVGKIVDKILEKDGVVCITADHGNAEMMTDIITGKTMTSHTTDPVPFIYVSREPKPLSDKGMLADIAPTLLQIMGVEVPEEMTGKSLIL